ncbi:MAG: hypothetical protein FJZ01_02105 [Candidatus Sericytochromatia bacterium]|nr:hypothetical protein [Candidatus Tanganyikabacteria bacterium]
MAVLVAGCAGPLAWPQGSAPPSGPDYTLRGHIDLQGHYRVAVKVDEICQGMTVSMIDPNVANQPTISTSLSTVGCGFTMAFSGGFVPTGGRVYILEAIKGLDGGRNGADAIRLRTFIKFSGVWTSATGAEIKISPSTTAVAVLNATARKERGLLMQPDGSEDPQRMIGVITAFGAPYDTVAAPLSQATFNVVVDLVRAAMDAGIDGMHAVQEKDGAWFATLPTAPVVATVVPEVGVAGAPILIVGKNLGGISAVKVGTKTCTIVNDPRRPNTENTVTVQLPNDATTGNLVVTGANGSSNPFTYTVLPRIGGTFNPDNQ